MTSIVIDGPLDQKQHLREDGSPWPMAMVSGGSTVFADDATTIVAHLLPGYADIPDTDDGHDQALLVRWQSAVATASDVQALICADRAQEGKFDPAAESEDALTALFSDRTIPVSNFESWDHPSVPLVLVATDYSPFVERTPVTGNVLWIDPSDEVAFLHSLANLGVIEFYTNDEA